MIEKLKEKNIDFIQNASLKDYCTMKCDATAKIIIFPKNITQLRQTVKLCSLYDEKYFVLGRGSNLIFLDNNFVFISTKKLCKISKKGNFLICDAGASLVGACFKAMEGSLSGLEGLYGIPASVGGAAVMNARAFGCEVARSVCYVKCLTSTGKIVKYTKNQCNYAYKQSIFQNSNLVIVQVCFCLKPKEKSKIQNKMQKFLVKREKCQPKGFSAGCIFKNCHCTIAGKAIDMAGLGGMKFKNFVVSCKHCNFILNNGKGRGKDAKILIEKIKRKVYNKTKINLEEEVIFVGEK